MQEIQIIINQLLENHGLNSMLYKLSPINRTGNNKAFMVEDGTNRYFAKQFFHDPNDPRNRFKSEIEFLRYAQITAPSFVPALMGTNEENQIGLFEFIEGEKLSPGEIGAGEVEQAANFIAQLNTNKKKQVAALNRASEACFSVDEHLRLVDNRINQLKSLIPASKEDQKLKVLLEQVDLVWEKIKLVIVPQAKHEEIFTKDLGPAELVISPSDFGFHNAIRKKDGEIVFIDFEYAGWDDPAKLIGDFFCQIQVPIPGNYFNLFAEVALNNYPTQSQLIKRARLLFPVFQIKWVCIALNVFLPIHLKRRLYSNPSLDVATAKLEQIKKASQILDNIIKQTDGLY